MAKRKLLEESREVDPVARLTETATRLVKLVALLLVKGESQGAKAETLSSAGFSPAEIGELLGTSANAVSVMLYQRRKRKKE